MALPINKRAEQLIKDNINIKVREFCELTGLSAQYFYKLKRRILKELDEQFKEDKEPDEFFGLKTEVAYKLKTEILKNMKNKYGFANLKGTPLERI